MTPLRTIDDFDEVDDDFSDPDLIGYQDRLASLRDERGIARVRTGGGISTMLLRHADVARAYRDDTCFSKSEALRDITFPFMGPNLQGYDGHEHTVKRRLVSPAFRRTAIPRYIEPHLRPAAEGLADEIAPLGEVDLMATFAKKYPMRIITQMLGIPRDDEDKMAAWAKAMLNIAGDPEGSLRANAEFRQYVEPIIEERRSQPGDDLLSALVHEEVEGQRLDLEEVLGFLRLLFPAGVDTTWLTLGTLMRAVLEHPETIPRLQASEEEREWAVEETVRWESTTGSDLRRVVRDVVVADVRLPAGELVQLGTPVANRDPLVFDDPDRWDLDRRPVEHIGFGLGRHFCLGAFLARTELNVALETLLRRLPNLQPLESPPIVGTVLRGPKSLRVSWDAP